MRLYNCTQPAADGRRRRGFSAAIDTRYRRASRAQTVCLAEGSKSLMIIGLGDSD